MFKADTKANGIQSIEVGMDIIKKISDAESPLSITDISILCNTSKSRLHRYLISFVRTGILEKSSDAKYTLGAELILLGLKGSQKLNITELASPHLIDIKETLNETTALAVWGEHGPFFLSWEESNGPVNIGIKRGSRVSLTQSAAGRVFASFLPKEVVENKINQELSKFSINREQFQDTINFVKDKGYAFVNSTLISGISAIASPIFDQSSKIAAVLTIVGLENSLDTSENSKSVSLLKERSIMISKSLGWNGD